MISIFIFNSSHCTNHAKTSTMLMSSWQSGLSLKTKGLASLSSLGEAPLPLLLDLYPHQKKAVDA